MKQGKSRLKCTLFRANNGWLLTILLVCLILGYSLLYFNNTYPISEGWGINYVELIFHGKVPYRDFYYYLPPLNLLVEAFFWKLSFGFLLVFRCWYLLQRIVIFILLFRLLLRFFHKYHAFIACALTVILGTGDVYDLFGDYNQTMTLLTVLLIYAAVSFLYAETLPKKIIRLGLTGIVLGCMFLNKQTIFIACGMIFFVALIVICILNKDKKFGYYCLAVIGGAIIPLIFAFVYLVANKALIPFIEQVFIEVDSKGSLFDILVNSLISRVKMPEIWGMIALLMGVFSAENVSVKNSPNICEDYKNRILTVVLILCGMAFWISQSYKQDILIFGQIVVKYRSAMTALLFSIAIFAVFFVRVIYKRKIWSQEKDGQIKFFGVISSGIALMAVNLYSINFSNELYTQGTIFPMIQNKLSSYIFLGSLVLFGVLIYLTKKSQGKEEQKRCEALLVINCGGFSMLYSGVMASGGSPASALCLRISLPLLLCILFSITLKDVAISHIIKGSIVAVCLVLCMACVSQKITCSYSWWGSYMDPLTEKTYSVDIPAMAGLKVSADQKELYETVTQVIQDNTSEDAVILGYPHITLFNILTNRYSMNTFVPVLFYDVVADVYVEKELEMLQQNLPDVIVWEEIPGCKETHESVFRNGELLKQREIESYLLEVIPEQYTLMANVSNVSVYILNDSLIKN